MMSCIVTPTDIAFSRSMSRNSQGVLAEKLPNRPRRRGSPEPSSISAMTVDSSVAGP